MTTKHLEYCINLVDKGAAGLRGLTPILKQVLLWIKCYQIALHATRKSFVKGINGYSNLHCCHILRNCIAPLPQSSAATTLISQQPSTWRQNPPPAKKIMNFKGLDDG